MFLRLSCSHITSTVNVAVVIRSRCHEKAITGAAGGTSCPTPLSPKINTSRHFITFLTASENRGAPQRELKLLGMLCYVIWIEGLVPSNTTELIHIHALARTMCSPVIDFYFQRGLLGLWMEDTLPVFSLHPSSFLMKLVLKQMWQKSRAE